MAWASSGGYPGVRSNGGGGLEVDGDITSLAGWIVGHLSIRLVGDGGVLVAELARNAATGSLAVKGGVGLYGHAVEPAQQAGGVATAGPTYTNVEQQMLDACYDWLQKIGALT